MAEREIINAEIGSRLREARKSADLTLEEAGKKIGLSGSVIRRYEIGTIKSIGIDVIKKFTIAYNTTAQYVIGWDENQLQQSWSHDPEVVQITDNLKNNPDMRILFDASRNLKKEDIEFVVDMIKTFKKREGIED